VRRPISIGADNTVRYVSTRGEAAPLGFIEATLAGLAEDGGLYVPAAWPRLERHAIAGFAGRPYAEVAVEIMRPFIGGAIPDYDLARMAREAYCNFRHPAVSPLMQFGVSDFLLELFHGPTLAFKDLAMQFVARLIDYVLTARGERITVAVATSGDTGAAAIEAFRGRSRVDLFVLFPHGRISDVQRRMMTTVDDDNVHALAIDGTFDDCQALVKAMFNHPVFRSRTRLAGVNSINWARIIAQVVYFFTSAVALGSPSRNVAFTVPTGNFGDVYAGYVALRMGLPIDRLVIATNVNDILARTIATGSYDLREVVPTSSPSMDIQVASNFERLLFEAYGRDGQAVRALMATLGQSRGFALSARALSEIRAVFSADRADEEETAATMRTVLRESGRFIDPHTAVGIAVSEKETRDPAIPMVVLATAHAAKFPDAVQAACGVRPPLPEWLADLGERRERVIRFPVDQIALETHILSHSRAAQSGAAA
jgi:threonine synthase